MSGCDPEDFDTIKPEDYVPSYIMQFFKYKHLPVELQEVSAQLCATAQALDRSLQNSPEKSTGLRKLLEAKDCFVRAKLN